MKRLLLAACAAVLSTASSAQPITLEYEVTITERARVLRNGATPHDARVNLSLGDEQAFSAGFRMTMTFEYLAGHANSGFDLFLHYGTPTLSPFPLPQAEPLIFAGEPDASILRSGGTIEQQSISRVDGSGLRNWGAFLSDSVIRADDVQSGSTTILSHMRPATFAGPWEFERDIPLTAYLSHMQEDLEFDFTTWTYFYPTGDFTADSYNYRGIAHYVPTVPEPSAWLLMLAGVVSVGAVRRAFTRRHFAGRALLVVSASLLSAGTSLACDDLDDVVGYTLLVKTNVKGSFNGCEHDKLIEFDNGWILRCGEYNYRYAYHPDAYIFAKRTDYQGRALTLIKACIDGEMFDMRER